MNSGREFMTPLVGSTWMNDALPDVMRTGVETATIEGLFDLSGRSDIAQSLCEMGIDCPDEELVVRRVLSATGKSKVYLNGSLSPLNGLRDIVTPLITGRVVNWPAAK